MVMLVLEEGVTLAEIDEAITHVYAMLKDDRYGNRLTWQQRALYRESIDELLDARLLLTIE
jgi:citrate lyase beta subunit